MCGRLHPTLIRAANAVGIQLPAQATDKSLKKAACHWQLDTSPLTQIDSAPREVTYSGSAMFHVACQIASTVSGQLHWVSSSTCDFEYSLDGMAMRALESGSQSLEVGGLADGRHNITVRACDTVHATRLCDAHPPLLPSDPLYQRIATRLAGDIELYEHGVALWHTQGEAMRGRGLHAAEHSAPASAALWSPYGAKVP